MRSSVAQIFLLCNLARAQSQGVSRWHVTCSQVTGSGLAIALFVTAPLLWLESASQRGAQGLDEAVRVWSSQIQSIVKSEILIWMILNDIEYDSIIFNLQLRFQKSTDLIMIESLFKTVNRSNRYESMVQDLQPQNDVKTWLGIRYWGLQGSRPAHECKHLQTLETGRLNWLGDQLEKCPDQTAHVAWRSLTESNPFALLSLCAPPFHSFPRFGTYW